MAGTYYVEDGAVHLRPSERHYKSGHDILRGLAGRVGWGVMGQRGEMGLFFKLFIKKYKSCINKRLWSR